MITLRQLRYLDALARSGHFGRAARACAVTQPALSTQIRDLEAALGVALVERGPKGARLTPAGVEAARRASEILGASKDLTDAMARFRGPFQGVVRLGVIPTIAPYATPGLLARLKAAHSELRVEIREAQTGTLLQELVDATIDLALCAAPIDEPALTERTLFEEPLLLAGPPTERPVARAEDCAAGAKILLLDEGHCFRDHALSALSRLSGDFDPQFGAASLSTLVQLAAAHAGYTLLPRMAVDVEARRADIAVHRFDAPEPSRRICLAWRAASPRAEDYETLAALLTEPPNEETR